MTRVYSDEAARAYATGWDQWRTWASAHGHRVLPATGAAVALWVQSLGQQQPDETYLSPHTVRVRLNSIPWGHHVNGYGDPDLTMAQMALASYESQRRGDGWAERSVDPLAREQLLLLLASLDGRPIGVRDRAAFLLAIAVKASRTELAALDLADLAYERDERGVQVLVVNLRSRGQVVRVPRNPDPLLCPVAAVVAWTDWLSSKGKTRGALWLALQGAGTSITVHGEATTPAARASKLTGHALARMFQRRAERAGFPNLTISADLGRVTGMETLPDLGGDRLQAPQHGGEDHAV